MLDIISSFFILWWDLSGGSRPCDLALNEVVHQLAHLLPLPAAHQRALLHPIKPGQWSLVDISNEAYTSQSVYPSWSWSSHWNAQSCPPASTTCGDWSTRVNQMSHPSNCPMSSSNVSFFSSSRAIRILSARCCLAWFTFTKRFHEDLTCFPERGLASSGCSSPPISMLTSSQSTISSASDSFSSFHSLMSSPNSVMKTSISAAPKSRLKIF